MKSVLHSFRYSLDFVADQVADVTEPDMAAQPDGAANHPSWIIGHLTFACQMLGGVVGLSDWLPNDWAKRFGPGSTAVANGKFYLPKREALAQLYSAGIRLSAAVTALDEPQLDAPFPDEAYIEVFPTVRHALTQVLVGHTAFHVGQLSVWRKAMGLPAMDRSYE